MFARVFVLLLLGFIRINEHNNNNNKKCGFFKPYNIATQYKWKIQLYRL